MDLIANGRDAVVICGIGVMSSVSTMPIMSPFSMPILCGAQFCRWRSDWSRQKWPILMLRLSVGVLECRWQLCRSGPRGLFEMIWLVPWWLRKGAMWSSLWWILLWMEFEENWAAECCHWSVIGAFVLSPLIVYFHWTHPWLSLCVCVCVLSLLYKNANFAFFVDFKSFSKRYFEWVNVHASNSRPSIDNPGEVFAFNPSQNSWFVLVPIKRCHVFKKFITSGNGHGTQT